MHHYIIAQKIKLCNTLLDFLYIPVKKIRGAAKMRPMSEISILTYPRQIAFASSHSAATSIHSKISFFPEMYCYSLEKKEIYTDYLSKPLIDHHEQRHGYNTGQR